MLNDRPAFRWSLTIVMALRPAPIAERPCSRAIASGSTTRMRSSRDLVEKVLFPEPFAPAITTRVGCGMSAPNLDRFGSLRVRLPCDLLLNHTIRYNQSVKRTLARRLRPVRFLTAVFEDVLWDHELCRATCLLRYLHGLAVIGAPRHSTPPLRSSTAGRALARKPFRLHDNEPTPAPHYQQGRHRHRQLD